MFWHLLNVPLVVMFLCQFDSSKSIWNEVIKSLVNRDQFLRNVLSKLILSRLGSACLHQNAWTLALYTCIPTVLLAQIFTFLQHQLCFLERYLGRLRLIYSLNVLVMETWRLPTWQGPGNPGQILKPHIFLEIQYWHRALQHGLMIGK